jgi:type IV secretion system protein VirD4
LLDRDFDPTPHSERGVHPVVAQAARELLDKSENERSGVLSTAMSFLGLYRDPIAARVTLALRLAYH